MIQESRADQEENKLKTCIRHKHNTIHIIQIRSKSRLAIVSTRHRLLSIKINQSLLKTLVLISLHYIIITR